MSSFENLPPNGEGPRSFDVVASVDMYRFDLQVHKRILPETRQRVRDEELTYITEGMNRSLHTSFTLRELDNELVFFDRGQWRPYIGMLVRGLQVAQQEALLDPRKTFQAENAARDLMIGYKLQSLGVNEKLSWDARYPKKEELLYGANFLRDELGFQPARKLGFLYQAKKNPDGSLTLETQSVDNSDDDAFEAALFSASYAESASVQTMRESYDAALTAKHEDRFYAGRRMVVGQVPEDAWEAVHQHEDLISYFLNKIEEMSLDKNLHGLELENQKKQLTYGIWAALRQRLDEKFLPATQQMSKSMPVRGLQMEVERAFITLSSRGDILTGCGGSMKTTKPLMDADPSDVFAAIFGDEGKEGWTWKKGVCRVDNCPTRPSYTEVGPCDVCRSCQRWFDRKRDPGKLYRGLQVVAKSTVTTKKAENHKSSVIKLRQKV